MLFIPNSVEGPLGTGTIEKHSQQEVKLQDRSYFSII